MNDTFEDKSPTSINEAGCPPPRTGPNLLKKMSEDVFQLKFVVERGHIFNKPTLAIAETVASAMVNQGLKHYTFFTPRHDHDMIVFKYLSADERDAGAGGQRTAGSSPTRVEPVGWKPEC